MSAKKFTASGKPSRATIATMADGTKVSQKSMDDMLMSVAKEKATGKPTTQKGKNAAAVESSASKAIARAKELEANAPAPTAPKVTADKPAGKTVRKGAAPKAETPKKATKPPKAVVAFVARAFTPGKPVHVIAQGGRPNSGSRLTAHTHAALIALGMMDATRPPVPQAAILTVMGQTAVTYHVKERNFEAAPKHCLRLSISGRNKFANRMAEGKVDPALANAFMALFFEGKADAATGVAQTNVYQTMLPRE